MAILIVVETPAGTKPPPSFLSDKLNADWKAIKLEEIRQRCRISAKHAFSVNGKNPIDSKDLTLGQFVALTPENAKAVADAQDKTAIVTIKAISLTAEEKKLDNLDQSKLQDGLNALLGKAGKGVEAGPLEDASKLLGELTSLKDSYATKTTKDTYKEPADLTETEWENILFNNRMLHGYYYNADKAVLVRAPKRAFTIRRPTKFTDPIAAELSQPAPSAKEQPAATPGSTQTGGVKEYLNTLPGIPSFFVDDDSSVAVVELQSAFQSKMAKQGFSYSAIEANAAGKPFGADASASSSWSEETSHDNVSTKNSGDSTLQVRYSFPRVVVDLSPEYLQLSDECYNDIQTLTKDNQAKFERDYGNAFPTRIVLGGSLHSTRTVALSATSNIQAAKEEIKQAAGISFAAPQLSFGVNQASVKSETTTTGSATSNKSAHLTWEARGGDTVLCSNPPEWASTVKNYRYWRIIDQSHNIHLNKLIAFIDPTVVRHLEYPGVNITDDGGDDDAFIDTVSSIVDGEKTAEHFKFIQRLFNSQASFKEFNEWLKGEGNESLTVAKGQKFPDVGKSNGSDQVIQFTRWLRKFKNIDVTQRLQ